SPGLFYLDYEKMTIFRDTDLGTDYTAAALLRRCGLDTAIPEMIRQQQLKLKPGERTLLDNPNLDHAPTRDLFLRLSVQHDKFVENLAKKQPHTQPPRYRHNG